jgi:phosphate transport system permease protein
VVKSETQVPRVAGQTDVSQRPENRLSPSAEPERSPVRAFLLNRGSSSFADRTFSTLMLLCALTIFGIVLLVLFELISGSRLNIQKFGMSFFFRSAWDPVNGNFGALPFIYGTIASSILSLVIAVPLAVGVAIFLTEM